MTGEARRRIVIFSCAGAPLGAEVLGRVHAIDSASIDGIVGVVLSRPPLARDGESGSRNRVSPSQTLADLRLVLAYRSQRLVRLVRRRVRNGARRLGLTREGRWRYIEDFCDDRALPVHFTRDPSSPETLGFIRERQPSMVLMMTFHHILRRDVLEIAPEGIFNVHCSLLPEFRGADPIGDALRAGVDYTGISLHRVDSGIDTGEVVAQRRISIPSGRATEDGVRRKLADEIAEAVTILLREGDRASEPPADGRLTACDGTDSTSSIGGRHGLG